MKLEQWFFLRFCYSWLLRIDSGRKEDRNTTFIVRIFVTHGFVTNLEAPPGWELDCYSESKCKYGLNLA